MAAEQFEKRHAIAMSLHWPMSGRTFALHYHVESVLILHQRYRPLSLSNRPPALVACHPRARAISVCRSADRKPENDH